MTCRNKLRQPISCNLIWKTKIVGKYLYYSSATFWFWSVKICYLKLSIEAQTLKAVIQNLFKKSCLKDLKFLKEHPWNFTKNVLWNQTFPSFFIAISYSFVYKEMMYRLRNLKRLQANPYWYKTKNINSVIFIITVIK